MHKIIRTDAAHPDFIELVRRLDAELAERDGAGHSFYARYNTIGEIKYAVVAYENERPIGCGAIKEYEPGAMEVKRMYTLPEARDRGIASRILTELEKWAAELSCEKCVLETGKRQPEAIRLYRKSGYTPIPNYGQYVGVENSICWAQL